MAARMSVFWTVGVCLAAGLWGCPSTQEPVGAPAILPAPAHARGTIGQYVALASRGDVRVSGYGVVMGLGDAGSTSVPPWLADYFKQTLSKQGLGSWRAGMGAVTPAKFLKDPDTAIVLLGGSIPLGAPKGSRLDVFVQAIPNLQTRSLAGGVLLSADMHLAVGGMAAPGGRTKRWAKAFGPVFINPFVDPSKPGEAVKLLSARIIAGGTVLESRQIRLRLRQPDWARCVVIQRKINERFGATERVANAVNPSIIELTIPRPYRKDPEHFLQLLMSLPSDSAAGVMERRTRQIKEAMTGPAAPHEELALAWEAMGRESIPLIQDLYASENPAAAFYAARTGLRLGDAMAAEVLLRFAGSGGSGFQMPAVEELGRHPMLTRAVPVLRELLDDSNELVRVAAYEALLAHGDQRCVTRVDISRQFQLDLVSSHQRPVIYATEAKQPKIVLFGRDMTIARPVFFSAPDGLVTVNARAMDEKLTVFRKIPRGQRLSDALHCDFYVRSLIEVLGRKPEPNASGQFTGLGLTYGQVVSVLYRMCQPPEPGIPPDVPAKFVLQQPAEVRRLYRPDAGVGRPDMPGP